MSTRKWRHGRWYCTDCGSQMRLMGPPPAVWRHYAPRRDWNKPLPEKPQQLVLWGELTREPCETNDCPCVTAGPDRDGIGGKTR